MGALERARVARRGRLGGGRARQPARRVPVERRRAASSTVATDIAAHAALMGFSVQLFETLGVGRGAARARRPRPTYAASRACTPAAGYACFVGRRRGRAARTRTGPPSWRRDAALRAVRARLRDVHRGARRRCTAATSTATSSSPARWRARYGSDRGYGIASYVDGLQSAGRVEEALALTEESVAAARDARQPVLDRLRAVDRGHGVLEGRTRGARWRRGTRASPSSREHRVQFFEGFLARDAARLHTSDGEPEAALVLFAEAIAAFQRAGNVPQLIITLASVPALFERLDRLEPAADAPRRDVARAVELPPRPRAGRPRRPARRAARARRGRPS